MNALQGNFRGHGVVEPYWNGGGLINRHSVVLATLTEIKKPQGEPLDFPHMGAAPMWVENIVPGDDGIVKFRCYIGWGSDLDLRISWVVF